MNALDSEEGEGHPLGFDVDNYDRELYDRDIDYGDSPREADSVQEEFLRKLEEMPDAEDEFFEEKIRYIRSGGFSKDLRRYVRLEWDTYRENKMEEVSQRKPVIKSFFMSLHLGRTIPQYLKCRYEEGSFPLSSNSRIRYMQNGYPVYDIEYAKKHASAFVEKLKANRIKRNKKKLP